MFSILLSIRMRHSARLAAFMLLCLTVALHAEGPGAAIVDEPSRPPSIEAKLLIGLPGFETNSTGILSFCRKDFRFSAGRTSLEVPRERLLSVSDGDERVELGGTSGRIARMAIPYGGGLAIGAVAHKKIGLLTVEFLDASGAYHGAVFLLKIQDTARVVAGMDFNAFPPKTVRLPSVAACNASAVEGNTVRVGMISDDAQSSFPAEDRVLLYERLVKQLQSDKSVQGVYRAGNASSQARCAEFTISVQPLVFNKGDQAERASVGPLGHFVGTTRLSFHMTIAKQDGSLIFDETLKKSEGADSDSLNITKVISKAVVKNLRKSRTRLRKEQVV